MGASRNSPPEYHAADLTFYSDIGFTSGEAAVFLGVSAGTVRKWARVWSVSFPNKPSLSRRFFASFEKNASNGCWEWIGASRGTGYGAIQDGGRLRSAHRVSYELHHGPIPSGMCVCHVCDRPQCVNPEHLFLGTHKDNAWDKVNKGRANAPWGKQHHACKLSEADILVIRASHDKGIELSRRFGVCPSTITKIRQKKAHVHAGLRNNV